LGAGSGIDIQALTTSLTEAQRAPAKAIIDKHIAASTANISGYSAIKYVLGNLQTAFAALKDQSSFSSLTPINSQPAALSVTPGVSATLGSHSVEITQLAAAQRSVSPAFASGTTPINGGTAFNMQLSLHGAAATSIAITDATPRGVAYAINQANLGVNAQIVNTGDATAPYKIMVTGTTGVANDFTLTSQPAINGLDFSTTTQFAANALLKVDGVDISASSNQVKDAIPGMTLSLTSKTAVGTPATLSFTRDTAAVTTKLQAIVTAYNDAVSMLGVVSDPSSTVADYGASLVGNSIVSQVRNQIRSLITGGAAAGAPSSGSITALRDVGASIDSRGVMSLDTTKLNTALSNNFDNVVTMMSANQENLSTYSSLDGGVAGDAVKKITSLLASTGTISINSADASTKITNYQKDLAKLETRMSALKTQYLKQFSAMDTLVGQSSALRASMATSYAGMMATYTNK
jgi:flagellar hook-associated protein 2